MGKKGGSWFTAMFDDQRGKTHVSFQTIQPLFEFQQEHGPNDRICPYVSGQNPTFRSHDLDVSCFRSCFRPHDLHEIPWSSWNPISFRCPMFPASLCHGFPEGFFRDGLEPGLEGQAVMPLCGEARGEAREMAPRHASLPSGNDSHSYGEWPSYSWYSGKITVKNRWNRWVMDIYRW